MNPYALAADIIVVIHLIFALYIVLGEAFILIGRCFNLRTVRNMVFRLTHMGAILFVVLETFAGMFCPLTVWEYELREKAGQAMFDYIPFIPRLVHTVLFYDFPQWVFNALYIVFGAAVVLTFILIPPLREGKKSLPSRR